MKNNNIFKVRIDFEDEKILAGKYDINALDVVFKDLKRKFK